MSWDEFDFGFVVVVVFLTLFERVLQLGLGQRSHARQTCTVNERQPLGPDEVRMNKQGLNEI